MGLNELLYLIIIIIFVRGRNYRLSVVKMMIMVKTMMKVTMINWAVDDVGERKWV